MVLERRCYERRLRALVPGSILSCANLIFAFFLLIPAAELATKPTNYFEQQPFEYMARPFIQNNTRNDKLQIKLSVPPPAEE